VVTSRRTDRRLRMLLWTGCSSLYGRRGSARECCWFVRAGLLKTRSRSPGRFCFWREKQVPRPARADTRFPDSTQPWTVVGVTAPFIPTRSGRRVDRRRSTLRGAQGSDLGLHPNSAVFGRASSLPVRWLVLVVISQVWRASAGSWWWREAGGLSSGGRHPFYVVRFIPTSRGASAASS